MCWGGGVLHDVSFGKQEQEEGVCVRLHGIDHRDNSPAQCHQGGPWRVVEEEQGYTLLRNRPPVGCSGVLHSDEFLALSLLLLGSLSLMMSY